MNRPARCSILRYYGHDVTFSECWRVIVYIEDVDLNGGLSKFRVGRSDDSERIKRLTLAVNSLGGRYLSSSRVDGEYSMPVTCHD